MEKIFDYVFNDIIKKLPLNAQVWFIAVFLFFAIGYKFVSNNTLQNGILNKIRKWLSGMRSDELYANDLFYGESFYKARINQIHFDADTDKTKVFKIVLSAKLQSDMETVTAFLEQKEYEKASALMLAIKFGLLVNKLITESNTAIKAALQQAYGASIGNELFEFIMHSPDGFNEQRAGRIEHLFHAIDIIKNSNAFDNNIERTDLFISEINEALKSAIFNAEKSFRKFNGRIKGIIEQTK